MAVYTITPNVDVYGGSHPTVAETAHGMPVTVGSKFRVLIAGAQIVGVRVYSHVVGDHQGVCKLWNPAGSQIRTSGTVALNGQGYTDVFFTAAYTVTQSDLSSLSLTSGWMVSLYKPSESSYTQSTTNPALWGSYVSGQPAWLGPYHVEWGQTTSPRYRVDGDAFPSTIPNANIRYPIDPLVSIPGDLAGSVFEATPYTAYYNSLHYNGAVTSVAEDSAVGVEFYVLSKDVIITGARVHTLYPGAHRLNVRLWEPHSTTDIILREKEVDVAGPNTGSGFYDIEFDSPYALTRAELAKQFQSGGGNPDPFILSVYATDQSDTNPRYTRCVTPDGLFQTSANPSSLNYGALALINNEADRTSSVLGNVRPTGSLGGSQRVPLDPLCYLVLEEVA